MLTIREAQMRAFSSELERRFEDDAANLLRECCPARFEGASDADLLRFVREGMQRARSLRINYERDIFRYLGLLCAKDEQFGSEILSLTELPAAARLDLVMAMILPKSHE